MPFQAILTMNNKLLIDPTYPLCFHEHFLKPLEMTSSGMTTKPLLAKSTPFSVKNLEQPPLFLLAHILY